MWHCCSRRCRCSSWFCGNINPKCLRRSSGTPPVLCYDELNPQARSVIMLVHLLNANVEMHPIVLSNGELFTEDYEMLNSVQPLPELVHNGIKLTNSYTILMYICENFGGMSGQQLFPSNCYMRRLQIVDTLFFDSEILHRRHNEFMGEMVRKTYANTDVLFHEKRILSAYAMLERYLGNCAFIVGNTLTIADLAIVATLSALDIMFPIGNGQDKWPKLCNWFCRMRSLPMYALNCNGILKQREVIETFGGFEFPSTISPVFPQCPSPCVSTPQYVTPPQCVPPPQCVTPPQCVPPPQCSSTPQNLRQPQCVPQPQCEPPPQCLPQPQCAPEYFLQPECISRREYSENESVKKIINVQRIKEKEIQNDGEMKKKMEDEEEKRPSSKSFVKNKKEAALANLGLISTVEWANKKKVSKVKKKDEVPTIWPQFLDSRKGIQFLGSCKCMQNQNECCHQYCCEWNTCKNEDRPCDK